MTRRAPLLAVGALLLLAAPASAQLQPVLAFGGEGTADGRFQHPAGIAVAPNGYVYVADSVQGRVQKFTAEGRFVRSFRAPGPLGVAVGPGGKVYVVEHAGRVRVSVWSARGRFLTAFADQGEGDGQLDFPDGVAVDPAGRVYVADADNHRVEVFSADGRFAASIGKGDGVLVGDDQLSDPRGVALGANGLVFASDRLYRRVQAYSPTGAFAGSFGGFGGGPGRFMAPGALAAAPSGVYVADPSASTVQLFSYAGAFAGALGNGPGAGPGQLSGPEGVAVDCRGAVYVSDSGNRRVQRFGAAGATPCGNHLTDPSERLALRVRTGRRQRFRRLLAVLVRVGCDRSCTVRVGARARAGRTRVRFKQQRFVLQNGAARRVLLTIGERATNRLLDAVRRRPGTARVTVRGRDRAGRAATARRRVRLTG
ncbi:MAG TPA: NHL repeat-containing protein [Thermoleophilaceae bacterium]